MKLVHELIGYLYGRGQLDDDDLGVLSKEGFYTQNSQESQPETQSDDEDTSENPEINNDEQPLSIEDIEEQKAADEDGLSKKGKGKRAFKPEKKWSLEQFNTELLPQIEALDATFSPLYRLLMKGNKAEIRQVLTAPFIIDEDYIKDTLERILLYHYGQEPDLARAVLMTDYLESFFVLTKKLSPKNRDRVREWILGKKLVYPEPHREAIFWARQVLDLQVRILKIWRDLTPSVLNHHHNMGYGKPFLAKASEQEEGRLAAQLLMSFIFLHNFDNPKKPETTLFLLLEKEGQDDAYQTMSVFFPNEMHDLWLRVGDAQAFDMPYWLHKLNERYDYCLFFTANIWTFDAPQKPSLFFGFTNVQNGQKIVLDDSICDKAWFKYYENERTGELVAGVFCEEYEAIGIFSEGMAAVRKGGLWGFIDVRGILVIPCKYEPFYDYEFKFVEGLVACCRAEDDKCLYLDKQGKDAFPDLETQLGAKIQYIYSFSEAYACICTEFYWHIIDHSGRILFKKEMKDFSFPYNFKEGLTVIRQGDEWGFMTPFGEKYITSNTKAESYDFLYSLREGRAAIRNDKEKWGFVDAECRLVIPCIYDWAWSFSEERAAVCRDGLWGFIDLNGHEIIPPQYKMTQHFWNGMGGFLDNSGWGFLNKNGQIIASGFDKINVFSENQTVVVKNKRTYFLDTNGIERFCHHFNPHNLTDGYFICLDPPSGLKIVNKRYITMCTIPDIYSVSTLKKDMAIFESEYERSKMYVRKRFEYEPYTLNSDWCLSEGFIGLDRLNSPLYTFAFLDDDLETKVEKIERSFRTFYFQKDLFLVDVQQKIGIKIVCPPDSYVKSNNRVVIKIGEEAIILRYDLIFEIIWKIKV